MQLLQSLEKILCSGFRATLKFQKSYNRLKLKLRVFLAGHIVAMVTYCATNLTGTCSPMIGQFFDTMISTSTDIECFHVTSQVSKLVSAMLVSLRG